MAWIFLAESADSLWPCHRGLDLLPTVSKIDGLKLVCCQGCGTLHFRPLPSGMTSPRSYRSCCPDLSTSSTVGSPARTLALQELEQAWKAAEADCFSRSYDYAAIFDPVSFSWKTSQLSLFEGLSEFSWSSLRYGMTVAGRLYQPQKWAPSILEKDGSYLDTPTVSTASYRNQRLPTLTAKSYGRNKSASAGASIRFSLHGLATRGLLPGHPKGSLNPEWAEQAMGYPPGWTELKDWAMQWFRSKRVKRSCDLRELRSKKHA